MVPYNLGYRKRILLNTSSMPLHAHEISSRRRHLCFIFFSSVIEVGREIYSSINSTSRLVLGAGRAAANGLFFFIILLLLRHFMSSILTCGPFLHLILIWATGREFCLIPALWRPNHAHVTARSRPVAAIDVLYINLPSLKLVRKIVRQQKLRFFLFKTGFGSRERERAANRFPRWRIFVRSSGNMPLLRFAPYRRRAPP
jgi:hypothetical protein